LGNTLKTVGTVAGGLLAANVISKGASQITGFIGGSIDAAKDLGESLNAVNQVFEGSAQKVLDWGKSNATAFGLSNREFNQLVTPLGAMLTNYGFSADDAADHSINLAKRAADMASVFNTDVGTALEAIQAGLRGEADPLEKFGVGLNAAAIEAKALEMTGKGVASSLTDQEKKAASLALIMEQTAKVEGDFASTSDELANSQRIAAAKTEELQAKLGQKLLPVSLFVTQAKLKLATLLVDKVVPAFSAIARVVSEKAGPVLADVGRFIQTDVIPALEDVGRFIQNDVVPVLEDIGSTIKTDVAPALRTLGATLLPLIYDALVTLKQGWDDLRPAVVAVGNFLNDNIIPVFKAIGNFLIEHPALIGVLAGVILTIIAPWLAVIAVIVLVLAKWDEIKAVFTQTIPQAIDSLITKVKEVPIIGDIVTDAFNTVWTMINFYLDLVKVAIQLALDTIINTFKFWKAVFSGDWDAAWQAIKDQAAAIWNALSGIFGAALDAIKAVADSKLQMLKGIGVDIGNAIADGFNAGVGLVEGLITGLANKVIGILNGLIRAINSIPDIHMKNPFGDDINIGIPDIPTIPTLGGGTSSTGGRRFGGAAEYAEGGIVTRPTLALIGERGPEAVVPLERSGALRMSGDVHVHLHVGAMMGTPSEARRFAKLTASLLRQHT
jgi:hypothetical protein